MKKLIIGGKHFTNRFFLGTGKFASTEIFAKTLEAAESELLTTSLTRVDLADAGHDDILRAIDPSRVVIMLNTSGARNAEEAIRIARFGKAAGYNWIKLEIHPDARYLLPDPVETLRATEVLVKEGMIVLPYINADPVIAHRLAEAGAAAVMPLAAPIGTNLGIKTETMLRIMIEQSLVPVVVDAGIGLPSHAAAAIELGADAVLINTAVASADNPVLAALAFKMAIRAAELGLEAGPPSPRSTAIATSPLDTFTIFKEPSSCSLF